MGEDVTVGKGQLLDCPDAASPRIESDRPKRVFGARLKPQRIRFMKEIRVQLPDELLAEIERRVQCEEFGDASELIREAVLYYAERHAGADWEHYLKKEVEFSRRHAGT